MKNKFTSIIMCFITIGIIIAFILLGAIVWDEIKDNFIETSSDDISAEEEKEFFDNDDDISKISKKEDDNEIKTDNDSNPLSATNENNNKNEESNNEENDVENISPKKYFYKQLNSYSKKIYKEFEKNYNNIKSGTYKLEFGNSFYDILSKDEGQDELGNYYQSAIEAYTYDNPETFFLSPGKMYLNIEKITRGNQKTYNVYIDSGDNENYLIDAYSSKEEVEEALQEIQNARNEILSNKTGDTYKDVKMVHDYLVSNLDYDSGAGESHTYDIYGALVNHKCVCEGYAKAFKYLLNVLNIESTLVIGKGTNSRGESENHAWNYVKIDENWYAVDVTWDDPIIIGGGTSNEIQYKYFLKGSNVFDNDHFPTGVFTENGKEFIYPELSVEEY